MRVLGAHARPRVGCVGVGWIGRHRIQSLIDADAAEIVALCDVEPSCLDGAASLAPQAACYARFDQLLARNDLDALVIATPNAHHARQCIAGLGRGLAVFCQKPLARSAAETRQVVAAAARADRRLGVDFSYRHIAAARWLQRLVCAGELGHVYAVDLMFHNAYGPDKAWFYDGARSGGGCVIDLGVHLIDLALWVLDWPALVSLDSRCFNGGQRSRERNIEVEDYATARLDLAGGRSVRLACSWRLHAGQDCVIEASFYGTSGGAAIKNVGGSFYEFTGQRYRGTASETLAEPSGDSWGGAAIVEWARALTVDRRFDAAAWRAVEVAEILDRVYTNGTAPLLTSAEPPLLRALDSGRATCTDES
jgi:predicted dehydrogenase